MTDLKELNHREKVILAGCMKGVIMIDGDLDPEELDYVDSMYRSANFKDFDACLAESERLFPDEDDLVQAAADVRKPASRETIREALHELSLRGAPLDATRATPGDTFYDRVRAALSPRTGGSSEQSARPDRR
jgi:hypothetical protein